MAAVTALIVSMMSAPAGATAGVYSAPSWFPLRGSHVVACTYLGNGAPCKGGYHPYWALDLKGARGDAIYAAGAGQVVTAVKDQGANCNPDKVSSPTACPAGSRGNNVLIDHGGGVFSYYQHMTTVGVSKGDWVDETTVLGAMGDSGYSDPGFFHLHFERRQGTTTRVDPGPLKGCVGGTVKTYPQELTPAGAGTSWQGLATQRYTATSDGTTCTRPPTGGGGGKPKVDLVFAIDTTGSMSPYIAAVTASARAITDRTFSTSDARVALVDYKDLYAGCSTDGYAARVDLPFTATGAAFGPAVGGLRASGGCDYPESVYSGIMTALKLPWRAGAKRAVLVMGDAPPHDPEPVTGYTRASVAAAARTAGAAITGPSVAAAAARVAAAPANAVAADAAADDPSVAIYSINIDGGGSPYFEELAADTGGQSYLSSDPESAVEGIISAITEITDSAVSADAGGPYLGAAGEPVTFDASNSTGEIVRYEWDFNDDGTYDQATTLATVTHQYRAPYTGGIGLRVTTAEPERTATATADVTILPSAQVKYTGQRAGQTGRSAHTQAFVTDARGKAIAGALVEFSLGEATCTARSLANGKATCVLTVPTGAIGRALVSAATEPTGYFRASGGVPFTIQH